MVYLLGQGEAIHLRHLGVQQHEREVRALGGGPVQLAQRRRPAFHRQRLHPPVGQHLLKDKPVCGVVINNKHRQALNVSGSGGKRRPYVFLKLTADSEVEGAALTLFAFHPDAPPHQPDKLGRDGQTQARAAVFARGGAVRLGKRLEDGFLPVPGDADAGVDDGKMQMHLVIRLHPCLDPQHHLALFREFDGVADQIDDHLPQTPQIADKRVGRLRQNAAGQLQSALVGPCSECFYGVFEAVAQAEGDRVQVHPARLDLGKVQNIVDYRQQRVGGHLHHVQVFTLFPTERRVERQFRHTDDAVHGGADLVAHVRQKLRLGAIGLFGHPLRPMQRLFGPLALGHIPEDSLRPDDRIFGVVDRRLFHLHIACLAVGAGVLLHGIEFFAGFHDAPVVFPVLFRQRRRIKVEIGFADDLVDSPPYRCAEPPVCERKSPFRVLAKKIERQAFHQRIINDLGVAQRLLRPVTLLGGALQCPYLPPQFDLAHHLAAQRAKRLGLLRRQRARHMVRHAERAQRMTVRAEQRRSGIEPYARLIGDGGIITETRVIPGIRDNEKVGLKDGVGAERDVAGRFRRVYAHGGLEPLPIRINQADERDGRAANIGGEAGKIVERRFRQRIENVVPVQNVDPLRFIGGQKWWFHKQAPRWPRLSQQRRRYISEPVIDYTPPSFISSRPVRRKHYSENLRTSSGPCPYGSPAYPPQRSIRVKP